MSEAMRVLFVTSSPIGRIGGAAKYYLPAYMAKAGHPTGLVAQAAPTSEGVLEDSDVELFLGDWRKHRERIAFINGAIRSFQPDIVHVFFHRGCGIYPLVSLFRESKVRWLVDFRSPLLNTGWAARLRRRVNRWEVRSYDRICAHGAESVRTVIGAGFDVSVVPPGVELGLIRERVPPYRGSDPESNTVKTVRAVHVGSLAHIRRLETMLQAVKLAKRRLRLTLDIYGDGDARAALEEVVQREGLTDSVKFRGIIPRREVYQRLADYDIGLTYLGNPLHDTGPPLKTLEYLAAGLPVVATDTVGNRMFLEDGINGVLTGRDAESFGDGIVRLAQSPDFEAMSAGARGSVAEYDWERVGQERLIPIYENLLRNSDRSTRAS